MFNGIHVDEYNCGNCSVIAEHHKYSPNATLNASVVSVGGQTVGALVSPYGRIVVSGVNRGDVVNMLNMHYRNRAVILKRETMQKR